MTGWIIFGVIVLIIVLLLLQSVTVTAVYDAHPEISVKILCFTIAKSPADPKKKKRKKKPKKSSAKKAGNAKTAEKEAEAPEAPSGKQSEKQSEDEVPSSAQPEPGKVASKAPKKAAGGIKSKLGKVDMQMVKEYIESAKPPMKNLFRGIRIRDVYIDWVAGSEDAAKTALKYGGICALIYSVTEWVKTYFDAKFKEINIEADFDAEKDDIFAYGTLKLRIGTALVCGIWLAFRVAKTYLKYNGKTTKTKRPARVAPAGRSGR